MDEDELTLEEGYLLRTKLHIRCGIRRLNEKKLSAGIATVYDAMISGMRWFISSPQRTKRYDLILEKDLYNEQILYSLLKKLTVISYKDFMQFHSIMELGLDRDLTDDDLDVDKIIYQFKEIMMRLEILPFNYDELPPENPDLF
ncbi:MAG: hypothetical protein ACW981_18965 [Candidatus Hodarchaeales archaeon]|jgi:hypothetical protein